MTTSTIPTTTSTSQQRQTQRQHQKQRQLQRQRQRQCQRRSQRFVFIVRGALTISVGNKLEGGVPYLTGSLAAMEVYASVNGKVPGDTKR